MKRGRPDGDIAIDSIDKFEERWWSWWRELQPEGRRDGSKLRRDGFTSVLNWDSIAKHGDNGLFIILLTLVWWGAASREARIDLKGWEEAVDDAAWVIDRISNGGANKTTDANEQKTGTKRPANGLPTQRQSK